MSASADAPKVFISYSWKPAQHQQKVIALAERLMGDGVNVVLDVWDLREGQDKNQFMERMVTDAEIKRVLLICNKDYKEKADGRRGGVGAESMIMSGEIYAKAEQTKFIPLIFEADDNGDAYTPVFVHSRIYLDFKDEHVIEDSYEQLIRNIFDKPARKKPPLGIPPSYLDDAEPTRLATAHQVATIKNAFINERKNAPLLVKQYYSAFIKAIKDFEPVEKEFTPENFIELTLSRIEKISPLRDDFVHFLETYLEVAIDFDQESFHDFFEELVPYFFEKAYQSYNADTIYSLQFDYLRFFLYELLLHCTAVLLKREKFDILAGLLYDTFVIFREHGDAKVVDFRMLNLPVATLNKHQNERFQLNRVSVVGDNIKKRASEKYPFDELKQADLILFHVSELSGFVPNASSRAYWRPETTPYSTYGLPVFSRMVSQRYFEKIKVLFDVQTKEELAEKIKAFETDSFTQVWYRSEFFMTREIPQLSSLIKLDRIGTVK